MNFHKIITNKPDLTNSDLLTNISIANLLKHVYEGVGAKNYGICVVSDLKKYLIWWSSSFVDQTACFWYMRLISRASS